MRHVPHAKKVWGTNLFLFFACGFGTKTLSVMKLELGTVMVNPSTPKKVWLGSHLFVSNEQIGFKSVSFFFFFFGISSTLHQ
jgi:hypothetical protein